MKLLEEEKIALNINGYNKAPPSIKILCGATVHNNDIEKLLPWLDWGFHNLKNNV